MYLPAQLVCERTGPGSTVLDDIVLDALGVADIAMD